MGETLSVRALNRALLARQLLLRRAAMPPLAAVEHLAGMQAQRTTSPYLALWSRLDGFRLDELGRLLTERRAVRATMMRGTVHLVSAADAVSMRPVIQPVLERDVFPNSQFRGQNLDDLDMPAVLAAGRELLESQPRSAAQLRELLAPRWPDRDPAALTHAIRLLLPVVHVPPRGVWGRSGPIAFAPMDSWLGKEVPATGGPDRLLLRYLAAFGPATAADAQTWSGLRGLREVFDRLRPTLRTFRDERGRELFDLPEGPRPDPDVPAPPRFLPDFDNLLLSHADRSRVISDEYRKAIATRNGQPPGTILLDGFVRGTWRSERDGDDVTLTVRPFEPLAEADVDALRSEGRRLLGFTDAGAASHEEA